MRAFGSLRIASVVAIIFLSLAECMPNKELNKEDYLDDGEYDEDLTLGADYDDPNQPDVAPSGPVHVRSRSMTLTARPGDTVELPCLVDNSGDTVINWLKDNEFLFTDNEPMSEYSSRFTRAQNFSLILRNVTEKDDSHQYRCQVLVDPPIEIVHKLYVVEQPRELSKYIRVTPPSRIVEVRENESVKFGCTASDPKPEIIWSHKGSRLHGVIENGGSYILIKKATRHHAGTYQCLVENGDDKPPTDAIEVIVKYTPVIEVEHETVHTGIGMKSELTCTVDAHPHADITWHKNSKMINEKKDKKYFVEDKLRRKLVIEHTAKHDLGQYTCVAKNEFGETSRTIELTGAPSRPRFHGGEVSDDESTLILEWHAESYSPILEYNLEYRPKGEMEWTAVSPPVTNGKGNQFTVKHPLENLQPGAYEAKLSARNEYGWSPHSKVHTFREEYKSEEAEKVKHGKGSAVTRRPLLALTALLLVAVSSFESTYL